jgi:AraC-like DNA-binding protein
LGHLLLIFPLGESAFSCAGITIESSHYILLTPGANHHIVALDLLESQAEASPMLVLWLSPPFLAEMARFLHIPDDLQQLLHGQPLLQGDPISSAAAELAAACRSGLDPEITEDLFLEVVGEVLRLMRLRHQALQKMARHKDGIVADLLPRLLLARQFIEARYTEDFRSQEVAERAGLSEFHFARLFRTAFDISPRQHVIHLRLDAARRLLEIPGNTVTEAAFQVGYGSLSSFIHAFSKRFELSPAQYRARVEKSRI